jgi:AraC family transcriptional regulator
MAKRIAKRKKPAPAGRKIKSAKNKAKPVRKVGKAKPVKKAAKAKSARKPVKKAVKAKETAPVRAAKTAKKQAKPIKKPAKTPIKRAPAPKSAMAARVEARHDLGKAMVMAGLGGWYDAVTMRQIPALWQRFASEFVSKVPARADHKVYYGVCANMDGKGGLDYYAAVEVPSAAGLPAELKAIELAPRRYAVFTHRGPVAKISDTWMAIFDDWMRRTGHTMADAPSFELYHDDRFDPKTGLGEVEIWIPLLA